MPTMCNTVPLWPTAQRSFAAAPHTPLREFVVGLKPNEVHALPFQCRIVPFTPTTVTSLELEPQAASSESRDVLGELLQVVPLKWTMVPRSPTAQTSFGPVPQTPYRLEEVAGGLTGAKVWVLVS